MDPNHFPHSNRRNINSSWNVDDEDEDWSTEQQSTNDEEDYQDNEEEDYDDEEDEGFANRNSNTHFENRNSNTHFENRNSYQRENLNGAEDYDDEEDEGFAEDMEDDDADDDEEDEEKYAKIDEEEEDDDGDDEGLDGPYAGWAQNIPSWHQGNTSWQQGSASWQQSNLGWPQGSIGWQKGNSSWQQQNGNAQDEHQRHIGAHQQHHLPIQSETSSGEEYRVNEQVGVGGDEGFGYPLEENPEQSDQEVLKTGDEESGYNENGVEEQGKAKDVETVVPKGTSKGAQKRKSLAAMGAAESVTKKSKKKSTKSTNVWSKGSSRKGGKKNKGGTSNGTVQTEDTVNITPVCRIPDKVDDTPDMKICLSKIYKAEKVELSEDRLTAGSTKGYRMVRANRGAVEGAWYFEIKVVHLGETGHTRLGWSTEKGDVQAPVGYDANSYSYRDVDGSKVHKAVREPYGDGPYVEGDVIGFYINLPNGSKYAPKPVEYVLFKGQLHYLNNAEEPPKIVPGSEISFFRNGKCQGVAFRDIIAGRYYPAASMYTLPNQSNCTVQFNFGPTFDCFPEDFGERPLPKPMYEAPYCGFDGRVVQQGECLVENGQTPEKRT